MGHFSAQRTRHTYLVFGFLLFAVLLFTAGSADAGTQITKCNDCHGMPPKDAARLGNPTFQADVSATLGSHQKHLVATPVANDCVVCHGAAITATDHQNNVINMASPISGGSYGKGVFFNQTSIPLLNSTATCATVSCHADPYSAVTLQTPIWGTVTANCSACHATPIGATGPATGGHVKHGVTDCSLCHTGATTSSAIPAANHADGNIDVANGYPANVAKHAIGTYSGTCSTATCHANVYGTGTVVTPVWGVTAGCSACHSVAIGTTGPATGSHVVHNNPTCTACHAVGTTASTSPSLADGHTDGNIDVTNGYPANVAKHSAGSYSGTCSTAICHGQGAPTWGATSGSPVNGFPYSAAQCGKCHSESGSVTAGTPFYSTAIPKVTLNTNAKVGAHTAHLTSSENLHPALVCAECHGTVALADATHMNGSTTFNFGTLAKTGGLTPLYSGGVCSSVYCHGGAMPGGDTSGSNRTPSWNDPNYLPASLSVAGCGTCHGFPPPNSTGHPVVTIPAGFPGTVTIGTTCSCHSNVNPAGNRYANIFVDYTKHINGTLEGGTCNACHGYPPVSATFVGAGKQNNWSSARIENYAGGGGAHTINGHVSKLAKHNDGFAFCSKCHSAADHATSPEVYKPSTNIKVNVNPRYRFEAAKQFKYSSNRLDAASHVTGNCSNSSCHFGASPKWDPAH